MVAALRWQMNASPCDIGVTNRVTCGRREQDGRDADVSLTADICGAQFTSRLTSASVTNLIQLRNSRIDILGRSANPH